MKKGNRSSSRFRVLLTDSNDVSVSISVQASVKGVHLMPASLVQIKLTDMIDAADPDVRYGHIVKHFAARLLLNKWQGYRVGD